MTLEAGIWWALGRAVVVAGLAALIGWAVARLWRAIKTTWARRCLAVALIAPLLTPAALVGYAYGSLWALAVPYPALNEALYSTVLLMRLTPVAVGVWLLAPSPPIDPAAAHARRLSADTSRVRGVASFLSFLIRSRLRTGLLAASAVFLLAFSDLEMANLFHASAGRTTIAYSWTIWVFDNQVLAPTLTHALRSIVVPMAIQMAVLLGAMELLTLTRGEWAGTGFSLREGGAPVAPSEPRVEGGAQSTPRLGRSLALPVTWAYVVVAVLFTSILPLVLVSIDALRGVATLPKHDWYLDLLRNSVMYGVLAAIGALGLAWVALRVRRGRWWVVLLVCAPGLLGSLVLALAVQAVIIQPAFDAVYDTPIGLVAAHTLWLAPVAVLLCWSVRVGRVDTSLHSARLLRKSAAVRPRRAARRLAWAMRGRPIFWVGAVLFVLAYFEAVAATALYPTGGDPMIVRVYSFMHFNQAFYLSAMVVLMMAVPVVIVGVGAWVLRVLWRE